MFKRLGKSKLAREAPGSILADYVRPADGTTVAMTADVPKRAPGAGLRRD